MKEKFVRFRKTVIAALTLVFLALLLTGCGPLIVEDGVTTVIGG